MNKKSIEKAINSLGGATKAAVHLHSLTGEHCTAASVGKWKRCGVAQKFVLWVERESSISRHLLSKYPLPLEKSSSCSE